MMIQSLMLQEIMDIGHRIRGFRVSLWILIMEDLKDYLDTAIKQRTWECNTNEETSMRDRK